MPSNEPGIASGLLDQNSSMRNTRLIVLKNGLPIVGSTPQPRVFFGGFKCHTLEFFAFSPRPYSYRLRALAVPGLSTSKSFRDRYGKSQPDPAGAPVRWRIFQNPNAPFINSLVNGAGTALINGSVVNISKQLSYATGTNQVRDNERNSTNMAGEARNSSDMAGLGFTIVAGISRCT